MIARKVTATGRQSPDINTAYRRTAQVWMLRILLKGQTYRKVGGPYRIDAEEVANAIELELSPGEVAADSMQSKRLTGRLREIEGEVSPKECALTTNLRILKDALGLSATDKAILEYLLLIRKNNDLYRISELFGGAITLGETVDALSTILNLPQAQIKASLQPEGRLRRAGLIRIAKRAADLTDKILMLTRLLDVLSLPQQSSMDILSAFATKAPSPTLTASDFEEHRLDYQLIADHLKAVLNTRRVGSNILIHGAPGVGKTQMVRTLTSELGIDLYEVSAEGGDGDPISTEDRLDEFQFTLQFLSQRENTAILFDEVEDVFPRNNLESPFGGREADPRKGWLNKQLEGNPAPVFWVVNNVEHIDPAHLRRFDIVLELRPMSAQARKKMLNAACEKHGIKAGRWLDKAAEYPGLSPALIEKITSVVGNTHAHSSLDVASVFERVASGVLGAMQLPPIKLQAAASVLPYSVELIRTDADAKALVAGLRRNRSARLLCYGPPGTGKTAFAQHIADDLGLPLLQFRASDILGPYVGMTEQNIAKAFRQARDEGAVMLLDEIDSLLRSRDRADRSWEVSQVNELLVQMEDHPGILVACTNFRDGLDAAAARRFDLKIKFDYLAPDAAWSFFQQVLRLHKRHFAGQKQAIRKRVYQLRHLTPGDFKAAVRRLSLSAEGVTALGLVKALEGDVKAKSPSLGRGIGFLAAV